MLVPSRALSILGFRDGLGPSQCPFEGVLATSEVLNMIKSMYYELAMTVQSFTGLNCALLLVLTTTMSHPSLAQSMSGC